MALDLRLPALSRHTEWAKHNPPTNYVVMVKHAHRKVLAEGDDGRMKSAAVIIDGRHYNEWTCLACGESARSLALSDSEFSQRESQKFLGWIRQHYDYNGPNHVSYEEWLYFIELEIDRAAQHDRCIYDDFGVPYVAGLNVPTHEEIVAAQNGTKLPGLWEPIDTTGREVDTSGTIFLPVPAPRPAPERTDQKMSTNPKTSVTLYDLDPETYSAVLALVNGDTPAAPAKAEKKGKEKEAEKTAADDFEPDAADGGSDDGDGDTERKVYTEKELNKLGGKSRDNLVPIAVELGIEDDIKGKRVPKVIELILAKQIELSEPDGGDSDDFKEDEPEAKSDKKAKGKDKKKGKKGKKG